MATNDQHRINKDVSARKNTEESARHLASVAAQQASHDAYVNSIIGTYDARIEALEAQHAEESAALKKAYDSSVSAMEAMLAKVESDVSEKQQAAVNQAAAKAHQDSAAVVQQLRAANVALAEEKRVLQSSADEALAKMKTAQQSERRQLVRHQSQIVHLKEEHQTEVGKLHHSSWFEVSFKTQKRKTRTYHHRPSTTFSKATEALCKDVGTPYGFRHKGVPIANSQHTLAQVCIRQILACKSC